MSANTDVRRGSYPELLKIIDLISGQNSFQRKRITAFVNKQDDNYWEFGEELMRTLNRSFIRSDQERLQIATSYNRMCMDFLCEEIRFKKSGTYLLSDARTANEKVYSQQDVMRYYMAGALLSYLFWPNHYEMFRFFKQNLPSSGVEKALEVGVGHGLFNAEVSRRFPGVNMTVVDISETSIKIAGEMYKTFGLDPSRVNFVRDDFLDVSLEGDGFDLILMGEVLEHVNDAPGFLRKARGLLRAGGTIYMSTCVNCPALDHVYHFHTVEEIRSLIRDSGLSAAKEIVLPLLPVPEERWKDDLVTINYAAYLTAG
jgi:ubiquinone/menaquinone biosynthesis C-methylase UbiE